MEATKAIFWDNDGVLVETEHLYFQATQHVLASVGIPLTQQDYVELFLVQGRGAWHVAMERGIGPCEQVSVERIPFVAQSIDVARADAAFHGDMPGTSALDEKHRS